MASATPWPSQPVPRRPAPRGGLHGSVRGWGLAAAVSLFCLAATLARASLVVIWKLDQLARAPVLVTGFIEETSRDPAAIGGQRTVMAHAEVRVLRSYPPAALAAGQRIRLDYEAIPEGASARPGAGPPIDRGAIFALPLQSNPQPASAPWRLIADQGVGLVVPAIAPTPRFAGAPQDGRDFLLREIASELLDGARREVLTAAGYASEQGTGGPGVQPIGRDVVNLLKSELPAGDPRWPLIAALTLGGMGIPRPGVADLREGKDLNGGHSYADSFITAVLQELGPSEQARQSLIGELLANSDIASWGVGMTVPEFAHDPGLTQELRRMLRAGRPGALSVARSILIAGEHAIRPDATALSLRYIFTPGADFSELQAACWVIRDFGSDAQFNRLLDQIRAIQYRDRDRYRALVRNLLWSDSPRERAVLDIMLHDDRIYDGETRYSDLARGELQRIGKSAAGR